MNPLPTKLLCVDLQADAVPGCEPDQRAMSSARELLTVGRRLGWTIAHTRRRTQPVIRARAGSIGGINPLMSEQVFFHDGRSIAESPGLATLLRSWRDETVLVAAFDHVALLSCLLACHEPGPLLMLVEDVTPLRALEEASANGTFHGAAWRLAFGATTIPKLVADAERRQGVALFPDGARL
jgi:hypothetical protein